MIWSCFSYYGPNNLVIIFRAKHSPKYFDIHNGDLMAFAAVRHEENCVFNETMLQCRDFYTVSSGLDVFRQLCVRSTVACSFSRSKSYRRGMSSLAEDQLWKLKTEEEYCTDFDASVDCW